MVESLGFRLHQNQVLFLFFDTYAVTRAILYLSESFDLKIIHLPQSCKD